MWWRSSRILLNYPISPSRNLANWKPYCGTVASRERLRPIWHATTQSRESAQLERLDWQNKKKPGKIDDQAAYLVEAIKNDYAAPKGFVSAVESQRRAEAKLAKDRQAAEARRQKQEQETKAETKRKLANAFIERLAPEERAALEAKALAAASPESRESYETPSLRKYRDTFLFGMLREYVEANLLTDA